MNKKIVGIGLVLIVVFSLVVCGYCGVFKFGGKLDSLKVVMVIDIGGVDDKLFN